MDGAQEPELIVVAESSAAHRELLASFLTVHGFTVVTASDSRDAVDLIRAHRPSAALVDLEMPERSGIWVLQQLRAETDLASIPVLFLTSRTDPDRVRAGLEFGAHDYVRKPVDLGELLARVRGAVALRRARLELGRHRHELETSRQTDRLTGLPDRDALRRHLGRFPGPVSVIMLAIADLDAVHADRGFDVGDDLLMETSRRAAASVPAGFLLGRWDASTFVAVTHGRTDHAGLEVVAERLRSRVAGRPVLTASGLLRPSVSIGVATGPGRPDDVLLRARAQLARVDPVTVTSVPSALSAPARPPSAHPFTRLAVS